MSILNDFKEAKKPKTNGTGDIHRQLQISEYRQHDYCPYCGTAFDEQETFKEVIEQDYDYEDGYLIESHECRNCEEKFEVEVDFIAVKRVIKKF